MSKLIANQDNETWAAGPPSTKTLYLAQISWTEPAEGGWAEHYPAGHDVCKCITATSSEDLREQIQHYRFLRSSMPYFDVIAWVETQKLTDGKWKIVEKHDLAVREGAG
jgi:hypothetical protein